MTRTTCLALAGVARLATLLVGLLTIALSQAQVTDAELRGIRDDVRQAFDPSKAGVFYAASINFVVQPDIATANFSLDGLEEQGIGDPHLDNHRLPIRYRFDTAREDVVPFVQATIGYQDLSMDLPFFDSVISTDWQSRGINVGAGVEYGVADHWTLIPSLNVGLADLKNTADYGDSVLGPIFQPVFEGILFDWETRAWVAGAALGARYDYQFERFRLRGLVGGSANHVRSFDESSPDISIRDTAMTLDLEVNTVHPIGRVAEMDLALVTIFGVTSLVGDARGELGFDEFAEAGLALQFDVRRFGWPIDNVRIGLKAIEGPDVSGWSLVIGQGI